MSRAHFEVAYDGEALRDHAMDVQQLAPALMSLGNLVREANAELNGPRSKVKVLVQSDFEHKCFNINLEVIQTLIDHVKALIQDDNVSSAKEILEWLGLLGGGGVIGYLKWRRGRQVESVTEVSDHSSKGSVTVQVRDGNTFTVNHNVYNFAESPRAKRAVTGIVRPLQEEGIDKITFRNEADHPSGESVTFDKTGAAEIRASCETGAPEDVVHDPQSVIAHLRVHSPVFDPKHEQWRFKYGDEIIYADIADTTIAEDALRRGGVMVNDIYKVRMTITEHETPKHRFKNTYKIIEVLEFTPADTQGGLFDRDEADTVDPFS